MQYCLRSGCWVSQHTDRTSNGDHLQMSRFETLHQRTCRRVICRLLDIERMPIRPDRFVGCNRRVRVAPEAIEHTVPRAQGGGGRQLGAVGGWRRGDIAASVRMDVGKELLVTDGDGTMGHEGGIQRGGAGGLH